MPAPRAICENFATLSRIRDVGMSSIASLGPVCTGLGGIKFGVSGAVEAVTRDLFRECAEDFVANVESFAKHARMVNDALVF